MSAIRELLTYNNEGTYGVGAAALADRTRLSYNKALKVLADLYEANALIMPDHGAGFEGLPMVECDEGRHRMHTAFYEAMLRKYGGNGTISAIFLGQDNPLIYNEALLSTVVLNKQFIICRQLGLPSPVQSRREFRLGVGKRIDVLLEHLDGSFTIIEVKCSAKRSQTSTKPAAIYEALGQILYYHEMAIEQLGDTRIQLVIASDSPEDPILRAAMNRVTLPIQYIDISPFLLKQSD